MTCIRVRRGRVVLDYRDSSGKRKVPSFGPATDEESWRKAKAEKARRRYLDNEDAEILFEEAYLLWLGDLKGTVDAATLARYEESGRLYFPAFAGIRLSKIRRRAIKGFVLDRLAEKKKNGKPRFTRLTVKKRIIGVLANFMAWAVDEEMLFHNPAREIGRRLFKRTAEEPTARASMTEDQMSRWTYAGEALGGRTYLGLMLMLDGGLRIGEMLGLKAEDLDFEGNAIHVRRQVRNTRAGEIVKAPKSDTGVRDLTMSVRLKEHLQAELRHRAELALAAGRPPCPWVAWDFSAEPTVQESAQARKHYERAMRKLCAAAGIASFRPHALRHTFGTIQADHGASARQLQTWYGHASSSMTEHYTRHARPQIGEHPEQEPAGVDLLARIAEARRPSVAAFESAQPTRHRLAR